MTVQKIKKTVFRCTCQQCGHQWEADKMPQTCAKCRRRSWNGEDRRTWARVKP